MIIVIMGVSGCGKTTTGQQLSKHLDLPFYDGDDFHPIRNKQKMSSGSPLNDEDRMEWLTILSEKIKEWNDQKGAVLACSALKERYRKILSKYVNNIKWIFLSGSYDLILDRMNQRADHYMPSSLLSSQFEILEIPSYAFKVDIEKSPDDIVNSIMKYIKNE